MTPTDRLSWSEAICSRIIASEQFASATAVMIYLATAEEPDLSPVARRCWETGRTVLAPRIAWESRAMEPAIIGNLKGDLMPTRHGLEEPTAHCPAAALDRVDLVLVPGLAFDPAGHRLGRGGGFYDRFLSRKELTAWRAGIALDLQIVPYIPAESHDVRLDAVITPTRLIGSAAPTGLDGG